MSEFLARLAARAVGAAGSAQPRVPARFEDSAGTEVSESGFGLVDEKVIAGAPTGHRLAQPRGAAAVRRSIDDVDTTRPAAPPTVDHARAPGMADRAKEAASVTGRAAPGRPADPQRSPAIGAVETDRETSVARALVASQDPLRPTAVPVPAAPTSATAAARPRPSVAPGDTASAATPEPPAVRVHIGRLEIRANLPELTPPPSRAKPVHEPAATSVSLADFLRGAR